jgi:WD40 repeat protein
MVDYSRFDNIDTESSEDETVTGPVPAGQVPPLAVVFEGHVGEEAKSRVRQREGEPSVAAIAFVDSNTVVTGGTDSKARIWDARTGVERAFDVRGQKLGMSTYCFNPIMSVSVAKTRGIVATASMDGCLRCFDFTTGAFAGCHDAARADITCAFSPDEKLIACGAFDGNIRILRAGHIVLGEPYRLAEEWPDSDREEDSESEEWRDPAVLADSKHHVSGRLAAAGRMEPEDDMAFDGRSLAWLDASTLVSAGTDAQVYLVGVPQRRTDVSFPKGLLLQRVRAPNDVESHTDFADIAVSPIEPLIAICRRGGAQMFYRPRQANGMLGRNEDNPSPFLPATSDLHVVANLAFTPDGLLLAMVAALDSHSNPTIISLHSVKSCKVERIIDLGSASAMNLPSCLAISPNGRRLAIGRQNGVAFSLSIETPKSTLTTFLLYRAASSSRATVSDDAPRACHLLAQLVDRGLVAAAAHAIDFLGC